MGRPLPSQSTGHKPPQLALDDRIVGHQEHPARGRVRDHGRDSVDGVNRLGAVVVLRQIEHGVKKIVLAGLRLIRPENHKVVALIAEQAALGKLGHIVLDRHAADGEKAHRPDLAEAARPRGIRQRVRHAPADRSDILRPTDDQRGLLQTRPRRKSKHLKIHCRPHL